MPRGVPKPASNPDYEAALKLLAAFRETWAKQHAEAGLDALKYSRLSVVALTQLSAIVAVDVGMNAQQFENVCRAQFKAAYEQAPRFG